MRLGFTILLLVLTGSLQGQVVKEISAADGLPDAHIYKIVQDSIGFIWMATENGIVRYDGQGVKIFSLTDGLANPDVWEMDADSDNRLWYLSKGKYQGFIQNDKVESYLLPDSISITPLPFWTDSGYVILDGRRVYRWKPTGWYVSEDYTEMEVFFLDRYGEVPPTILTVPYKFTLFYKDGKIFRYQLKGKKLDSLGDSRTFFPGYSGSAPDLLKVGSLKNGIYFTILSEGLVIWDQKDDKFRFLDLKKYLKGNMGRFSTLRETGDTMYLSGAHDIVYLNRNLQIIKIDTIPSTFNAVSYFKDRDNGSWYVSDKKVYYFSKLQKSVKHLLKGRTVTNIAQRSGDIVVTVNMDGVKSIDKSNLKITNIGDQKKYQVYKDVQRYKGDLYILEENNVYKLTASDPYKLVRASDVLQTGSNKAMSLDDDYIYLGLTRTIHKVSPVGDIYFDFSEVVNSLVPLHDTLYIGAADGLYYALNNKVYQVKGFPTNLIVNTMVEYKGGLLIGTKGNGLLYYKGSQIIPLAQTEEYFINKIIVKIPNIIWLATDKGVARIKLYNGDVNENAELADVFTDDDGIMGDFINDVAVNDSLLYVATNNGISILNWMKAKNLVSSSLSIPERVKISTDERESYTLNVNVIDYVRSQHLQKMYRVGDEGKWIPFKEERIILSNLDDGNHEVTVKVTDLHGHEVSAVTKVSVEAFWYESTLFRVLLILFLIGCTAAAAYYFTKRSERKRTQSIERAREKVDLQLQSLRSQMNPHFVFNSLNAIQYYIFQHDTDKSEMYLTKFAHLIRQFFEYSNFDRIQISEELDLLENYLKMEQLRFEDKLDFTFSIDPELDIHNVYIPSMLLQPIVENALIHGIFHKDGEGHILLKFKNLNEDYIEVSIEDDGIGFTESEKINEQRSPNSKYRSSEVLKSRIALLNKQNKNAISYDISELSENGTVQGTRVTLIIKKLKNS